MIVTLIVRKVPFTFWLVMFKASLMDRLHSFISFIHQSAICGFSLRVFTGININIPLIDINRIHII